MAAMAGPVSARVEAAAVAQAVLVALVLVFGKGALARGLEE